MSHRLHPVAAATSVMAILALAACGGGGSSDSTTSTPLTLTGTVVGNGFVKNAVVCVDLNANSACDADEPASAKTGADGVYRITVDTSKVTAAQVAAASLIAPQVPGSLDDGKATIDMASPAVTNTTSAYVLRLSPGKSGQINPLTTLVAAGVAAGMTEASARANVVGQLGLTAVEKIDDYQADVPSNNASLPESARTAAQVVASALQAGVALVVADQNAAVVAEQGALRSLDYTDAANYSYNDFVVQAKAAGTPGRSLLDNRVSVVGGKALAATHVYREAFLSSQGWVKCDASGSWSETTGTPNRSVFCGSRVSYSYSVNTSLAGQSMADVVTQLRANTTGNSPNWAYSSFMPKLTAALDGAKFPQGSSLNLQKSLNVNQPLYINDLQGDFVSSRATTLEDFIAEYPVANVKLPSGSGTFLVGINYYKGLFVAFLAADATGGTVQYYECNLDLFGTPSADCVATNTGTYAIQTINGVRTIRFAGQPKGVRATMDLVAEVKASQQVNAFRAGVYTVREDKPGLEANATTSSWLNGVAWGAMKTQLGL